MSNLRVRKMTVLSSLVALVTWLRQLVLQWYQQQRGAILAAMTAVWIQTTVFDRGCISAYCSQPTVVCFVHAYVSASNMLALVV